MRRTDTICLHVPEPLALIEATLLFTVQVLIARHPELTLPPEVAVLHPPTGLRAARHLYDAIRKLHDAIETYRYVLRDSHDDRDLDSGHANDDIPF